MTRTERKLRLDRAGAKWLGVCAGLAHYLDVEVWTVRLVFIGCLLFGAWFLVPLYLLAWWLLDEATGEVRQRVLDNQTVRHFRSVDYRKTLYRNPREGKLWGVCAGIADYLEVSAFTVRLAFVLLTLLTALPLLLYFAALLVLDKRPFDDPAPAGGRPRHDPFDTSTGGGRSAAGTRPSWDAGEGQATGGRQSSTAAPLRGRVSGRREFQYCANRFDTLQRRLARLEAYVTSKHFRLHREFRNL
ncbi:MAG: PspC domain-containing protein [Pseudohongiellaceae bacterium]|jgi:phage shock protein C